MTNEQREKLLDEMTPQLRRRLEDECLLLEVESQQREVLSKQITWSNDDMPVVLSVSRGKWQEEKAAGRVPPSVWIGGREFWLPAVVMRWLETLQPSGGRRLQGDDDNEDTHERPPARSSPTLPEFGRPPLNAAAARGHKA